MELQSQVHYDVTITTTEMHTGGCPVRIIESGYPVPRGKTILDKRQDLKDNYDQYRKLVILEPHGHFEMYGVLLVAPDNPEADIAAIFIDNEGYGTMCGHVCISLGRYAIDRGLIRRPITSPETQVNIQTPCGLIRTVAQVGVDRGVTRSGRVRFQCVPSFVVATDLEVQVEGHGKVKVDVAYGGAFYAYVTYGDLGLDIKTSSMADIRKAAVAVKDATKDAVTLTHPDTPAFLYGTMVVDTRDMPPNTLSTQYCIFADRATSRSPCGSGTSGRLAVMHHRGHLSVGQGQTFRSDTTGSEFTGRIAKEMIFDGRKAIIPEVEGQGHYIGRSTLTLEKGDELGKGFIVA